jgi:hypothetical protein
MAASGQILMAADNLGVLPAVHDQVLDFMVPSGRVSGGLISRRRIGPRFRQFCSQRIRRPGASLSAARRLAPGVWRYASYAGLLELTVFVGR